LGTLVSYSAARLKFFEMSDELELGGATGHGLFTALQDTIQKSKQKSVTVNIPIA